MDFEALKVGMTQSIPFVRTLGLEYVDLGLGSATVRLPERSELSNHVGSQHAGALFTVAEAASGAAFVAGFAERLGDITPLAKTASISYEKIARGPIDATATLDGIDDLLGTLDADGKVEFPIEVELHNGGGDRVATATVDWHLRANG